MAHRAVPDNGRGCLRAAALATDGSPGIGLGVGVAASGQAPGALDVRPVRVGPARLHVKSTAFSRRGRHYNRPGAFGWVTVRAECAVHAKKGGTPERPRVRFRA